MVRKKRRKDSRVRSRTRGWGSKHQGSGYQGGVGMAGSGKRADSKKPSIWNTDYFGMNGFKKKGRVSIFNPCNVSDLSRLASQKGSTTLDLSDFKFTKLLAKGDVDAAYTITVRYASASAIEKIKAAGGKVIVTSSKEDAKAQNKD